jgi:hypothetical protein
MASIQLELSDDLKSAAERRAAEGGHKSVRDYIESLVQADAAEQGEADSDFYEDEQLETLLLERLNDPRPGIEITSEFWDDLKRDIHDRQSHRTVP